MRYFLHAFLVFLVISAAVLAQEPEEKTYTVKMNKGWNLVYGDIASFDSSDSQGNILVGDEYITNQNLVARYRWVNPVNKNVLLYPKEYLTKENEKIYGLTAEEEARLGQIPDASVYFEDDADWAYFDKAGTISYRFGGVSTEYKIKLFKGWNTKTIMPWMVASRAAGGKKVDDFKGNCIVEDVAIYDATKDNWLPFKNEQFYEDMAMGGFAIKVSDNCELRG